MPRHKYPDNPKTFIDFETGINQTVPEHHADRATRLRRETARRRREALRMVMANAEEERRQAFAKAFRLIYAGKPFPVHFDVSFEPKEGPPKVERYSILDAAMMKRLDKDGQLSISLSATKRRPSRPKSVPPHFVHQVR